jgi:hypothetical protein
MNSLMNLVAAGRRWRLFPLGLLALAGAVSAGGAEAQKPNLILIFADKALRQINLTDFFVILAGRTQ